MFGASGFGLWGYRNWVLAFVWGNVGFQYMASVHLFQGKEIHRNPGMVLLCIGLLLCVQEPHAPVSGYEARLLGMMPQDLGMYTTKH